MAFIKNCKKDEALTKDTKPVEPVALDDREAEQVTGGVKQEDTPTIDHPDLLV